MVRNASAHAYESTPRPVLAVGNDYPAGHVHAAHRHRRAQLLYAERGTMVVDTEQGCWIVPPHEGVWIPAGVMHGMRTLSAVSTRSIYPDGPASVGLPESCQVLGISPLLRRLLIEAVDLPLDYDVDGRDGRVMALIVDELRTAPILPLCVPVPRHATLAGRCRDYLEAPSIRAGIDLWCRDLAMSRRTFTRLFRRETGLSFSEWQRRACLQTALPRLMAGDSVTGIALDLGYSSSAAFTAMFSQMLGQSPTEYRGRGLSA